MNERFSRNLPTLTEAEQAMLASRRVLIVGCGGLGGYLAEYAARLGVGRITLVDGDRFALPNINRQLGATDATLAQSKALSLAERLISVNPDADIDAVPSHLTAQNAGALLDGADVVLDALDSVPARLLLEDACETAGVPLVHAAIDGICGQIATVLPGMRLLRRLYQGDASPVGGTLSFVPAYAAALACSEAVKLLIGHAPKLAGKLLVFDLASLEQTILTLS